MRRARLVHRVLVLWGGVLVSQSLSGVVSLRAQHTPPAPERAPETSEMAPACRAPEFRQFDFWVGTWDVRDSTGRVLGTNTIDVINRGCGLREQWTGASGSIGTSLNTYDAGRKRWHQTWIDSDGLLLTLNGGLEGGAMTMSGEVVGAKGERQLHRIRWRPDHTAGGVRQTWYSSTDGGPTWTTAFDGFYVRRPPP